MLAVKGKTLELRKTRELDAGHTKTGEHYLGPVENNSEERVNAHASGTLGHSMVLRAMKRW